MLRDVEVQDPPAVAGDHKETIQNRKVSVGTMKESRVSFGPERLALNLQSRFLSRMPPAEPQPPIEPETRDDNGP